MMILNGEEGLEHEVSVNVKDCLEKEIKKGFGCQASYENHA